MTTARISIESAAPRAPGPATFEFDTDKRARAPNWPVIAKQRISPINYARLLIGGRAQDEARFSAQMRARLGADAQVSFVGRARSGLYLLTKYAIARTGRRRVLLSPYTIPDVVAMVLLAGGEPVFYDFTPNSTSCDVAGLAQQMDGEAACVIVTHYHVNEPRLGEISALCAANGAFLFKDCALALGGVIEGRPVGVIGDACVFSLSSFKLLNYFWGGMITTRNRDIAAYVEIETRDWPRLTARDYHHQARACFVYDMASRPALFNLAVFPRFRKRAAETGVAQSLDNERRDTLSLHPTLTSRPALAAFAEWSGKLERAEVQLAHRRAIAGVYERRLGAFMVSARAPRAGACFVNYPLIVPGGARDGVRRAMMEAGFDVGASLYPNAHRHPLYAGLPGRSANIDALVRDTLYLPTHFGVTPAYAARLADALAPRLGAAAGASPHAIAAE